MKIGFKRTATRLAVTVLALALVIPCLIHSASAVNYYGSASYTSGKYYTALKNVKLTGNQAVDIIKVAQSQIGYQESSRYAQLSGTVRGNGNCTEFGRWYGMQDQWCAMFVSWCANVAGISTSIVPCHAYTPFGLQWFIDNGLAHSRASIVNGQYTPKAGDIIYFRSGSSSAITNHIGIVTGYSNGTIHTVEGNTSSATVSTDGGAVCAKVYSIYNTYVVYVCSPRYKGTSISASAGQADTAAATTDLIKKTTFKAAYYASKYSDLKAAFGSDEGALYNHFNDYGIKEGRVASAVFDIKYYAENNPDLKTAFGSDYEKLYEHFKEHGYKEVRNTAPIVDLGADFYAEISNIGAALNVSINSDNGDVLIYKDTSSDYQTWRFVRQSNGSYKIINKGTGKSLGVPSAKYAMNTKIKVETDSGASSQRWFIHKAANGEYFLRPTGHSCYLLTVEGASTKLNSHLVTYSYNGGGCQRFAINKVAGVAEPPVISDVKVTNVTSTGFTVSCKATSALGINRVSFSSWSDVDGKDDLLSQNGTANGDVYTVNVKTSEHKGNTGEYHVTIVAYDNGGGMVSSTASADVYALPDIAYIDITNVTSKGYDVSCTATSKLGISRVVFNTRAKQNGNDDVVSKEGVKDGDTYTCRIDTADHDGELGTYITSIVAYDTKGGSYEMQTQEILVEGDEIDGIIKNAAFNAAYYAGQHSDLKAAYGTDYELLYKHFSDKGVKEGFASSAIFNVKYYLNNNPDLKAAFGNDYASAYNHFFTYGYKEDRFTAATVNLGADFYAEISNVNSGLNVSINSDNGDVLTYTDTSSDYQTWRFVRQANGSYEIINKGTGKSLSVPDSKYAQNTTLKVENDNGATSQRWFIYKAATGEYYLRPTGHSCYLLTVKDASVSINAHLCLYAHDGSAAQRFGINKVSSVQPPQITDIKVTNVTVTGYTVSCKVSSAVGVDRVIFTNWSEIGGIDDLSVERGTASGNAYTITVNTASHKGDTGKYNISIEAYDKEGNKATAATSAKVKAQPLVTDISSTLKNTVFNASYYTNKYSDLKAAFGNDAGALYTHFKDYGIKEGRAASAVFDLKYYLENNSDLKAAFDSDYVSAYNHFVTTGYKEDRPTAQHVDLGTDFFAEISNVKARLNVSINSDNGDVLTYTDTSSDYQTWQFIRQADGSYEIINKATGKCLTVPGAKYSSSTGITVEKDSGTKSQRWFVYQAASGQYYLRPVGNACYILSVKGASVNINASLVINSYTGTEAQRFYINKVDGTNTSASASASKKQAEVMRKIIYAVETGGQVYGRADYTCFIEAYTNTSIEHAITIGAGQWYGTEAKRLLSCIRSADPALFASLDTAGIGTDLDTKDWSVYRVAKGSAKAKCIRAIIGSSVGIACQDKLIDEQMEIYMQEARDLGVTDADAQMMCANIRHHGGLSAVKRVLGKTKAPYTLDNIYAALQTDTGNQVGAYRSRQKMVYNALKTYM